MCGIKLGTTDEERDIGVAIAKNLKTTALCSKAAGRATSVLNQISTNFQFREMAYLHSALGTSCMYAPTSNLQDLHGFP